MRHRATLFFLLSILLAIAPWLQWQRQQAVCAQSTPASGGSTAGPNYAEATLQGGCASVTGLSPWLSLLGIMSALAFLACLFFIFRSIVERREEQALLRGAGINLSEDELPLDD